MKYIAIKVKHFNYWIWFEISKTSKENCCFIGKKGWGKGGAYTSININENNIEGEINSDTLQYT